MSFAIVIVIAVIVLIFILLFTNIGGNYTKKTDRQLLDLWSLHENNVRAAKIVGQEAHKKALDKMSTLTNEMKKRGLLKPDFTQENEALDSMSRKLFSRGLEEIKSLAKSNDAKALYQLGMIFHAVKEVNTSIQYIFESANLGHTDAQYALGSAFLNEGNGVTRNACDAMKWLKIAAEQGHVDARKALDIVMKAFPNEADAAFAEAEKWLVRKGGIAINKLEQLAEIGDAKAKIGTGDTNLEGAKIQKDHQKAAILFSRAADQGRASAQHHLGTLYLQGKGVPQDDVQAAQWFLKAADQGHAEAQLNLGTLYFHGQGVPQDYALAMRWCRKAADQGHAGAQHNLGALYNGGLGVQKDYVQASQWYRKAADQGLAEAQYHLGKLYIHGEGVPQDYVQAAHLNRKAADQGHAEAQYHLSVLYDNGWGVPQDYVSALHWCIIAKANGCSNPTVDQTLQQLMTLVTPSQLVQAEESTSEWWAAHHQQKP